MQKPSLFKPQISRAMRNFWGINVFKLTQLIVNSFFIPQGEFVLNISLNHYISMAFHWTSVKGHSLITQGNTELQKRWRWSKVLFVNYGIVDLTVGRTSLAKLIPENNNSFHAMRWGVLPWENYDITAQNNFLRRIIFDLILLVSHFVMIIVFKHYCY